MALTLIGPSVLLTRAGSMFDMSEHSSNVTRVLMARSSLEMIADYPLFGTGLGTFDRVYPDYMIQGANPEITHPHQVIWLPLLKQGLLELRRSLFLSSRAERRCYECADAVHRMSARL